jgi:hypothetical protein
MITGITADDVLIIREISNGAFLLQEGLQTNVLYNLERFWSRYPALTIAGILIDLSSDVVDGLMRKSTFALTAGDAPINKNVVGMYSALDAHKCFSIERYGGIYDTFNYPVCKTIRMTGRNIFCNV